MTDLPLAWTGAEVSDPDAFAVELSDSERAAIVTAGRRLAAAGETVASLWGRDVALPELADTMAAIESGVSRGCGLVVLRGMPVDEMTDDEIAVGWNAATASLGRLRLHSPARPAGARTVRAPGMAPGSRPSLHALHLRRAETASPYADRTAPGDAGRLGDRPQLTNRLNAMSPRSVRPRARSMCRSISRACVRPTSSAPRPASTNHAINQGFLCEDQHELEALVARPELKDALSGFVFHLTMSMAVWDTAALASALARDVGLAASVHLRMTGANLAGQTLDDHTACARLAEAVATASAFENVTLYDVTLIDFDCGYFPRGGVLDRRFNPRPGLHVVRHLNAALNGIPGTLRPGDADDCFGGRYVALESDSGPIMLVLPQSGAGEVRLPIELSGTRIVLMSGEIGALAHEDDRPFLVVPG